MFDQLLQVDWPVFLKEVIVMRDKERQEIVPDSRNHYNPGRSEQPWTRGQCEGHSWGV